MNLLALNKILVDDSDKEAKNELTSSIASNWGSRRVVEACFDDGAGGGFEATVGVLDGVPGRSVVVALPGFEGKEGCKEDRAAAAVASADVGVSFEGVPDESAMATSSTAGADEAASACALAFAAASSLAAALAFVACSIIS